ncbi:hypothetical protein V6N13_096481 [Hibiscus sabdariffa]
MENNPRHDPNPDSTRPEEPEFDLYTIPSYSSWFVWNDIHETERQSLKEFFQGSSISRTPKSTKSTGISSSTNTGKTLLAASPSPKSANPSSATSLCSSRVRVENGAPSGVRVVATPNSLRPLSVPVVKGENSGDGVEESGVKLPPLASYSDVFGDLKRLHCGNCDSGYHECRKNNGLLMGNFCLAFDIEGSGSPSKWSCRCNHTFLVLKINFVVCLKCFKSGNYGEGKSMDDFELKDCSEKSNVQTKSKLDCITKLIELPFGESLIDSPRKGPIPAVQVAHISTMVKPQITAAAAESAVALLSDEMSCPREIFYGDQIDLTNGSLSPTLRAHNIGELEIKERSSPSESQEIPPKKSDVPLPLRIRAAVATGLGAAAARAKLLAVQEEREIEHLVATIIEAQLKKLQSKLKHCDDAELLMEKEYTAIEDLKEHILGERINILRMTYDTSSTKLLAHSLYIHKPAT